MITAVEGGEWSAARPGRTLPRGKTRYPLYRRLGGPQSRSGHAEILVSTGIRSPDRPARSSVAIPTELAGPQVTNISTKFVRNVGWVEIRKYFGGLELEVTRDLCYVAEAKSA